MTTQNIESSTQDQQVFDPLDKRIEIIYAPMFRLENGDSRLVEHHEECSYFEIEVILRDGDQLEEIEDIGDINTAEQADIILEHFKRKYPNAIEDILGD